jgi:hypothetical protein
MPEKTKLLNQIKKANELIHYFEKIYFRFQYSFIVYAGEILKREFISKSMRILSRHKDECTILFSPVRNNCEDNFILSDKGYKIINREEMLEFYLNDTLKGFYCGHVYRFYNIRGLSSIFFNNDIPCTNIREGKAVVLNESLCYSISESKRILTRRDDLFQKLYYIGTVFKHPKEKSTEVFANKIYYSRESRINVYNNLSKLAIQYADELYSAKKPKEAAECLLFSKMVNALKTCHE